MRVRGPINDDQRVAEKLEIDKMLRTGNMIDDCFYEREIFRLFTKEGKERIAEEHAKRLREEYLKLPHHKVEVVLEQSPDQYFYD